MSSSILVVPIKTPSICKSEFTLTSAWYNQEKTHGCKGFTFEAQFSDRMKLYIEGKHFLHTGKKEGDTWYMQIDGEEEGEEEVKIETMELPNGYVLPLKKHIPEKYGYLWERVKRDLEEQSSEVTRYLDDIDVVTEYGLRPPHQPKRKVADVAGFSDIQYHRTWMGVHYANDAMPFIGKIWVTYQEGGYIKHLVADYHGVRGVCPSFKVDSASEGISAIPVNETTAILTTKDKELKPLIEQINRDITMGIMKL